MYNPKHNEISLKVYNMHLFYDHTMYSKEFFVYYTYSRTQLYFTQ